MAYKRIMVVLASVWLSLVGIHQVIGREVPNHHFGKTKTQEKFLSESGGEQETQLRPREMYPGLGLQSNRSFANAHLTEESDNTIQHWAIYKSRSEDRQSYFGMEATLAIYSHPDLNLNQTTSALVWVVYGQGGPVDQFNAIHVGWTVNPQLYADTRARFFVYWTADGYQNTGCYDLRCEGFHLLNGAVITPGDVIDPVSTGKGTTYGITFRIFKDETSGDWWLYYGQEDNKISPVGYFPKTLFGGLAESSTEIDFGGYVDFEKGGAGPPMGNGRYPGEDDAAYFKGVQYISRHGEGYLPTQLRDYVNNKDCYQVGNFVFGKFYYGGPGGCIN